MTRARDLGDFIADGAAAELVVDTTTLVVDSTNNRVGIGTASPSQALDVVGNLTVAGGAVFNENSADVDFRVESDNNTHALFVEGSSGNVGIGTSSLDVSGNGSDYVGLSVIETSGTRRGFIEIGDNQNADTGGIGDINFVGTYQSSGHKVMASVRSTAEGSTSGQRGANVKVLTKADGSSSLAERFRFGSAGQLGIGGATYGTSGQILTSGGSGAAPSWADAAGGGGQFDAVASGTIANGALVSLNSDGSVSPTSGFAGAESVFADGTTTYCDAVFDSNSNKSVIFYKFSGAVKARVATTSGTSISYGTEATASSNSDGIIRTAFDSNSNKIVVFFKNSTGGKGSAVVGTISGTNISFGSVVDVTSYAIQDPKIAFDSNSNKIVVAFKEDNPNRGKALVGTVSGTSISFGSEVTFQSNNCYPQDMVFDTNSNKIVLIIKDDSDDDDGQALVGTVSGTSISFGTKVKFTTGNGEKARMAFDSNSNKVVIVFRDTTNSSYLSSVVGTVSGTSISFGSTAVVSQVTVSGVNIGVSFDSNINKTIVAFPNGSNSNKGTMAVGTVSGTSISFSPLAIFNPASTEHIASTFDSSANKFIIVYSDEGNGDDGTAIAADGLGIDNFSKWIGFASAAISNSATGTINVLGGINEGQSSLEVGSTYYLTDAAALSTTLVSGREVGKALSATKLLITQGSITQ